MSESNSPEVAQTAAEDENVPPNVYMSVCFHSLPHDIAEDILRKVQQIIPAGISYAVYFDEAIVVDEI